MNTFIQLGKGLMLVFWLATALHAVRPISGILGLTLTLGTFLALGVHTLQAFFFIRKFKGKIANLSNHALLILCFG